MVAPDPGYRLIKGDTPAQSLGDRQLSILAENSQFLVEIQLFLAFEFVTYALHSVIQVTNPSVKLI
ncbi:hypothetical protein PMG71_18675 [Roseofilum sp. BLCC_M154]|uniref:Uncharacterized protein n=1 Tax=Roseofilum acuticapitatum BLCC-M154 TaxID=3022444 RepID=A0ABT7AX44_9CYAN|nr:hypothetical protein [Roseofilum acuticapitatum]MDJ1171460.1 hypothetical protein [Roseofilum acuticapitatum BLCC-M154]